MLAGVGSADRWNRGASGHDELIGDAVLVGGVRRGRHEVVEVQPLRVKNCLYAFLSFFILGRFCWLG